MGGLSADAAPVGRLAGKVAIITGAASGFGLATVHKYIQEGAKVVAVDLNEQGLVHQFHDLSSSKGANIVTRVGNVTSAADWAALTKATVEHFGQLDILVNNAGTNHPNKRTEDLTEAEFDSTFNVNVKSIYLAVNAALPYLRQRGGGLILNVSSVSAGKPRPGLVWYAASKAAVNNVTKGLAADYGKENIRINAVCPLLSGTGLFEAFTGLPPTEENMSRFLSNIPLGRLTATQDVANALAFLGSDEAAFITAETIKVDGGRAVG